jgi:hypothetical protein
MSKKVPPAQPAPHSWSIECWPQGVYPCAPGKGRYLVRCNRTSLLAAGALTRIGRDLVVLGGPFSRWLESQAGRVEGFQIAPNCRETPPDNQAAA